MSELLKRAGNVEVGTWLDGHPRWASIKFHGQTIKSMQPEDLRDLRYCIDRFLVGIEEYDARFKGK